jgi:hypothetical protein
LLKAQTLSTGTEVSTPETNNPNPMEARMMMMVTNMTNMTTEFKKWMSKVSSALKLAPNLPDCGYGSQNKKTKNDRPANSTPTSHQSKRMDTRTTPGSNPMETDRTAKQDANNSNEHPIELFPETKTSPPLSPGPATQPNQQNSPPRDYDGRQPWSPTPETGPMFTDMATLLAALASPTFPNGYDSDDPQYVYKDNGDGTLFCVGLAAPSDF